MICCGLSDIGRVRKENQDYFLDRSFGDTMKLIIVCDGMGGQAGGREASMIAGDTFLSSFSSFMESRNYVLADAGDRVIEEAMINAAWDANSAIHARKREDTSLAQMGTTLVATFLADYRCYVINIGDSRMYWIHDGLAEQVTKDHSLVQYLVDIGQMTKEEALTSTNKNIITRALGISASINPDTFTFNLQSDSGSQYLLLCSDGFSNLNLPGEIYAYFEKAKEEVTYDENALLALAQEMIDASNRKGSPDNVTVNIIAVPGITNEEGLG